MILIITISYLLKQNIKIHPIFIKILKYLLPFFSNFLFGQFFLLLIIIFDCQGGHSYINENLECRKGNWFYIEEPFCIIALIFHFIIAYITNSLYCKSIYENSNCNVLKKTNTIPDITLLLTKIIIIITYILDKGEESEHWALLSFFIFITGINAYITVVFKNRENKFLNSLSTIFALILNVGFDSLFIGKIFKKWEFNGAIYLFFAGVIVIILYVIIHNQNDIDFMKINYKSIEKSDDCLKYIKKILDIINNKNNYRSNNLLLKSYITNIENNCLEIDCPLKRYINNLKEGIDYSFFLYQFCDKIFIYAINKFPKNVSLKMYYIIFLLTKLNNKIKSRVIYNELKEYDYYLSDGFKYFKLTKYFNIKNKLNFNNFNSIEYKNDVNKFRELIENTTFLYHRFWSSLLMSKIKGKHDFIRFNKTATKILKLIEKIDVDYNLLMKIKNNNIELIKLYTEFIHTIVNNNNKYEKQKEYLINLIYNDNRNDSTEIDFNNFFINILDGKDLYQYLVISAENKNIGNILYVSTNSCPIFGYKKEELINKNINALIPEILRNAHDNLIKLKSNNLKLSYYESITKNNIYTPEFFVKMVFAISKSKFLIPLKLKIYLVSTEEGSLVYIIEIIKENYNFRIKINNDINNKISENNFYKTCCVLTDENFIIQYFSPNCCNLLHLNYNDINSNHSIMNYIQQLYDEYVSYFNNDTTNNEKSDFQTSGISFQNKLKQQDKIRKYNIDNDINFMELYPSEIGKQKQEELVNKKYLLERKITWKKKSNININCYNLNQSRRQSLMNNYGNDNIKLMDSFIDDNSMNDYYYEQNLYMKIKKIKIQNKKIGYLFLFKIDEDSKMAPSHYNTGSNVDVKISFDKVSKIKPNSTFNKHKTDEIERKKINDFDIKNGQQQHNLLQNNRSMKILQPITGLKEDLDNNLNLNGNYIPNDEFNFEFNVNTFTYQPSKKYKENELSYILKDQAMNKINKYKKEDNKNDLGFSQSENSESDSESSEYSSSSESYSSNNSKKRNKNNFKKSINIDINTSKKQTIIPIVSNNNLNNNYYKINFDKIRLFSYDFYREMLVDITEKTEKKSQVELVMKNFKAEIEEGKEENYPIFNKQNMINKQDKKSENKIETKKNDINNPADAKLNEPKTFETSLIEAINKNERNKSFILFRNIFLIFLLIIIVLSYITEHYTRESFDHSLKTLELINNVISVRYSNIIGIYYLRELTLLNINTTLCNGNYIEFPAKNKSVYKAFIKSEILELFKESQSKMRKIISSNLPFTANTTYYLTKVPVNISILLPNFVIEKIEFNYLSALVMMHSVYFNLASSTTNVEQNQTDLYTYIHNSFNNIGTELKNLIVLFRAQLYNKIKKYKTLFTIAVIVIFIIFLICYFIIIYFYLLSVKIKMNYISLFFGVDICFIKEAVKKCEKYLLKLKYDNNKNSNENFLDDFENEDKTNFIESKKKSSNNNFLNKNKNFNKNSSLLELNRNKKKNMNDLNDNIFITLFGIISLFFYLYFIYIIILFFNILQKTANLSTFIYHFQHYQLSIIELFNTYREFLFDENTTIYNMSPYDYLNIIEDEIYDTRNDDTLYIQKYKGLLQPLDQSDISLISKDLCSFYQTDYFNSSEECIQTMGKSYNYEYSVFASHFVEQLRVRQFIILNRLENKYVVGNLTEYDVENWTEKKLGISCSGHDRNSKSFRTQFFNSAGTHSKLNAKFLTVILPYMNINRKVLLKKVSIEGDSKTIDNTFIIFIFVLIVISIIYLVPVMRNLYNAIYKTKKMLKLIPIHILAGQSNIEKLLNI